MPRFDRQTLLALHNNPRSLDHHPADFPEELRIGLHLVGPVVSYGVEQFGDATWPRSCRDVLDLARPEQARELQADAQALLLRLHARACGVLTGPYLPRFDADDEQIRAHMKDWGETISGATEADWKNQLDAIDLLWNVSWQTSWASLVPVNGLAGGGVIAVRIALCGSTFGDERVWQPPWSRYRPNDETWGNYRTSLESVLRWLEEQGLLTSDQSVAIDLVRAYDNVGEDTLVPALPATLNFEGESIGLPLVLALFAHSRGRELWAWSTGKIGVGPNGELQVDRVSLVGQKVQYLCDFLRSPVSGDELGHGRRRPVLLIPNHDNCIREAITALEMAENRQLGLQVNRPLPNRRVVEWTRVSEVFENFDILVDPFVLRTELQTGPNSTVPEDEEVFFRRLPGFAAYLANGWANGEADCDEVLLCTPFHSDEVSAAKTLQMAAKVLALELARQRRTRACEDDKLPAPLVADLKAMPLDCEPGVDWLLDLHRHELNDYYDELTSNGVRLALEQQGHLVLILIDTEIEQNTLRSMRFTDSSAAFLQCVFRCFRAPNSCGVSIAPQRTIWLFPNVHAQLFAEDALSRVSTPSLPIFKRMSFPDWSLL